MLDAVTDKLTQLTNAYPGKRILVIGENDTAVLKRYELGKSGVEMTVLPIHGGEHAVTILWNPSRHMLMVEEDEAGTDTEVV
ncbi:hypothetical protein D7S55_11855 [Ralstonia pickettii]|nr:hypothetical protein [Ralstonia pickettii]MBA9963775.1 hypothetical protein [Ralstonia pickettii]MBA9982060.1 hypothetical protein [Ralstonia pickettii]MBA9987523.1 hypothetical protein [Ralstonia pickettii]